MNRFVLLLLHFFLVLVRLLYAVAQIVMFTIGFLPGLFSNRLLGALLKLSRAELPIGRADSDKKETSAAADELDTSDIFIGFHKFRKQD